MSLCLELLSISHACGFSHYNTITPWCSTCAITALTHILLLLSLSLTALLTLVVVRMQSLSSFLLIIFYLSAYLSTILLSAYLSCVFLYIIFLSLIYLSPIYHLSSILDNLHSFSRKTTGSMMEASLNESLLKMLTSNLTLGSLSGLQSKSCPYFGWGLA